jgi:hypothetical protein
MEMASSRFSVLLLLADAALPSSKIIPSSDPVYVFENFTEFPFPFPYRRGEL